MNDKDKINKKHVDVKHIKKANTSSGTRKFNMATFSKSTTPEPIGEDNSSAPKGRHFTYGSIDPRDLSDADPGVPNNLVTHKPGGIRTEAQMTIHSRLAHAFFYGRKRTENKQPITGLVRFGHNVKYIWDMAALDDPYADAKLLAIEESLSDAAAVIEKHTKIVDDLLDGMNNIQVVSEGSSSPIKLPLSFRTPYGYIAGRLLTDFDALMMKILSAVHMGLLFGDDRLHIERAPARKIRNAFRQSSGFKASAACRDDFAANNQRGRTAITRLGELDGDIIQGKRRAKISPKINTQQLRNQYDNDGKPSESDEVDKLLGDE